MSYFDNIRTFIRVYELGNMSAAARDQRISAAVASSRIAQLEEHLKVRLFQRTTRQLNPTEQGQIFYDGALKIIAAVEQAESDVESVTQNPRGSLLVAAPLGIGRRLIAPMIPKFKAEYPLIDIRLRLSDRALDITGEGLDIAFFLGLPKDSALKVRKIADCSRILCAAPSYVERKGWPNTPDDLVNGSHDCLNLRYPGAPEFQWPLQTENGTKKFPVQGPYESDDGDVLTSWALDGHGIVLKPEFEVREHLQSGALVKVLEDNAPISIQLVCLYSHRRLQDPKTRLFIDFLAKPMARAVEG